MSYVNSIGGDPINPNPYTYSAISMTGDITLGWPISGQSPTYSATDWVDITSSAAYAATMPDATQVGVGREVVFNNYGSFTITINDNAGGSITTVAAGFSKRIHIVTNATAAGTWRVVNIGSGTSNVDASALAGYGLVAAANVLSQEYPVVSYNTNQTIISGSRAGLAIWTGGVGTFTLTAPATLGSDWFFSVRNSGSGTLTLNAGAALINGASTITAAVGEGFTVITDGSNFYTIGKVAPAASSLTLLNKSVAGGVDVTLTASEAAYGVINFTGLLTANINVIVPTAVASWYFYNTTTGAFTLTVKTAAGTGVAITQTGRTILYCDGTNVVTPIPAGSSGTVTSVTAGTGLSGGVITTTGTVALANTAVAAGTYGGALGVGSHTVDAQGRLTADSFTARSVTGTANEITVTNGDGVAGAPTVSLPTALTFTGKTVTGGTYSGASLDTACVGVTQAAGNNTTALATTAFVTTSNALYSHIAGFLPSSIAGTSTTASLTVSAGQATSSANAALITKSTTSSWAVSNGNAALGYQGGTTLPNSDTIHFFACSGGSGTTIFAHNGLTPTPPAGYNTYYRRIFSVNTNGSGALIPYTATEIAGGAVQSNLTTPVADVNVVNLSTARVLYTLSIPTDIQVNPMTRATSAVSGGNCLVSIQSPLETDAAPSGSAQPLYDLAGDNLVTSGSSGRYGALISNTSGQIAARSNVASTTFVVVTFGWVDFRR